MKPSTNAVNLLDIMNNKTFNSRRLSTTALVLAAFVAGTTGLAHAATPIPPDVSKLSGVVCPDGKPCPALPAGAVDCTPRTGSTIPSQCNWKPGKGDPALEPPDFDLGSVPDMTIVVGAARSATSFGYAALIKALGEYASMKNFYFDYGDGTGHGSSGNLQALTSFPTSHIYVQPGTYKVSGYAKFGGQTESATMTISVPPATEPDPTPDKVTSTDWNPAQAPAANAVIPVTSSSSATTGGLSIGTGGKTITEATTLAPSTTETKAPVVSAKASQVVIVSVPSLPAGADVSARVKIGGTWRTLPALEVGDNGMLTLPALTFTKAGTYSVKLTVASGGTKYVTVKVKK